MKFLIAALLLSSPSFAAETTIMVTKTKFLEAFKAGLPASFCGEKAYFRKCFQGTEESCKKAATAALSTCITDLDKEMPEKFKQPADGQSWGEKLGNCAGGRFEAEQTKGKLATADCKDASKWK